MNSKFYGVFFTKCHWLEKRHLITHLYNLFSTDLLYNWISAYLSVISSTWSSVRVSLQPEILSLSRLLVKFLVTAETQSEDISVQATFSSRRRRHWRKMGLIPSGVKPMAMPKWRVFKPVFSDIFRHTAVDIWKMKFKKPISYLDKTFV